jgi:hypothetical protein
MGRTKGGIMGATVGSGRGCLVAACTLFENWKSANSNWQLAISYAVRAIDDLVNLKLRAKSFRPLGDPSKTLGDPSHLRRDPRKNSA